MTDFAKLHAWWPDALLLKCGLITRTEATKRGVPHIKAGTPEQTELDHFQTWLLWRAKGAPVPRPANLAGWKPEVGYWTPLGGYLEAHKLPPPPPPPVEAVSRWKNPPWRGIGVHETWGLRTGQWTVDELIGLIARTRIEWVFSEGSPETGNEQFWPALRDGLHAISRRFGIWERADAQKDYPESRIEHVKRIVNTYKPDMYGADVEEFPVDTPELPGQIAKAFPDLPRVMLVPGQPDASFLKPWFDADFDMMTQSYAANIGQPPVPGIAGAVDHDTYWRGGPRNFITSPVAPGPHTWGAEWWQHGSGPHSVPIIETMAEGNPGLRVQAECDAIKWFGGNWSIWAAELMTDDDWAFVS